MFSVFIQSMEKALKTLLKSSFMQNFIIHGESFENIIEKLIYAKFQLFNTFLTFFQENINFFQETTKANSKKSKFEYAISYLN
jgi:hypothetical protein